MVGNNPDKNVVLGTREDSPEGKLALELIVECPEGERCEFLKIDSEGPYCTSGLDGDKISEERGLVCDTASLQLWCLDKERREKCFYYNCGGDELD